MKFSRSVDQKSEPSGGAILSFVFSSGGGSVLMEMLKHPNQKLYTKIHQTNKIRSESCSDSRSFDFMKFPKSVDPI
jgi:hypothetical protein